jgi:hypothetical protein
MEKSEIESKGHKRLYRANFGFADAFGEKIPFSFLSPPKGKDFAHSEGVEVGRGGIIAKH